MAPVLSEITLNRMIPTEPLIPKSNKNIAGINVIAAK